MKALIMNLLYIVLIILLAFVFFLKGKVAMCKELNYVPYSTDKMFKFDCRPQAIYIGYESSGINNFFNITTIKNL